MIYLLDVNALLALANIQQAVTYCFVTGATRAVLAVPAGAVDDRRPIRVRASGNGRAITLHAVELHVDGGTVTEWRANGASFAECIRRLPARSRSV